LKQAYQGAYLQGLRAYCQPVQHLESIRKQAQLNARPSFDHATYGNCAQRFPDLLEAYNTQFYRERDALVQKLCTFENGLEQGKADAGRSNHRLKAAPDFCDERSEHAYLRGYDRGWADQKREICLMEDFQERGYHDATNGLPANPRYPELCPSDFYTDIRERYQNGYERGRRKVSHPPHQVAKHDNREDIVGSCGRVFNFDSEKLQCIKEAQTIRFGAAAVVEACAQAFSFSSDRLKCIGSASGRNYNPTTVVKVCKSTSSFSSDVEHCITTVRNTRYEPSRAIQSCHDAFHMTSDRKACFDFIAKEPRDPSARIQSCKKNFTFASDVLKCLGT
jgi:ribosome modulation factor